MEILTRITGGWLTFKDLEKALDVPAVSLRRYHEKFPTYLVGKKVNRSLAFPRESIETFKMIYELYKEGLDTATVQATLAMHFAQTHDIQAVPKDDPSPTPGPAAHGGVDLESLQVMAPLVSVLADLSRSFQKLVENQERILEEMRLTREAIHAGQGPQDRPKEHFRPVIHSDQETPVVDKDALVREVQRLRGLGYGASRIRTTLVRAGWPSFAGPGRKLSKSTIAKIIKSNGRDAQ